MASSWRPRASPQLGAYTSLAQGDPAGPESPTATSSSQPSRDQGNLPSAAPAVYIGSAPTPEDLLFLPRVADKLPHGAFLVAIVELCERFAYYGLAGPLQNYMANGAHDIVVLFVTSLPWSVQRGFAGPGLVVAMAVIGLGTGGIKSNVSPLIAEQVRSEAAFVETRKGGKRVLVDPEMTVQRIYMIYYMWYV